MSSHSRKVLLGVSLLIGVALVLVWALHLQGRWAVARYQRRLLAAGEQLQLAQFLPRPVLPESNGAPLFSQTIGYWSAGAKLLESNAPLAMQMVAPGKAVVGWAEPDVRVDGTNTWSEVEAALASYDPLLESVRAAVERPAFDFQLDYRQGPSLLLPHLAPLKAAVQRLTTATLCDLHEADSTAATANLQTMLALVRATTDEHLAISQLVRMAMAHLACAATWELLQSYNVTDAQLAALQRGWTEVEFVPPAEMSLEFERALGQMTLEGIRHSSAQFRQLLGVSPGNSALTFGQTGDSLLNGGREMYWRVALSYPDQLRMLKGYQVLLESFRAVRAGEPFCVSFANQQRRLNELGLSRTNDESGRIFDPSGPDLRFLFSESVSSLSGLLHRVLAAEAARNLTITALALKRYELRHGQYPAELFALVPEFLPTVPRDPADGKPLRYQLQSDGQFRLYAIGEDGVDNGGDASSEGKSDSFGWQRGRDLVWPQPATPQEISAYRQHNSRKHGR